MIQAVNKKRVRQVREGSITQTLYAYFDKVGIDKAELDEALKLAKGCKADTKFDKCHFAYHKTNYRAMKKAEATVEATVEA